MGASNTEPNQTSLLTVSEQETSTNGDSKVHSHTTVNKLEVVTSNKRLNSSPSSSSSSSPDSTAEHPFKQNFSKIHSTSKNEVPISTLPPDFENSTFELRSASEQTISPPTQTMDRPADENYRIPSSVFERNKSNTPDWSYASNESLFSIPMGNSFIKEDFLWKSGELGRKSAELGMKPGQVASPEEPSTSNKMFSYSDRPKTETTDSGKCRELGVAVETMKEVLRECEDDEKGGKSISQGRITRNSDGSTSTRSFAFSMGLEKSNSPKINNGKKEDQEKPLEKVQSKTDSTPEQTLKSPTATPEAAKSRTGCFFSCFSCCPFCS